jgi:hypothetical protein
MVYGLLLMKGFLRSSDSGKRSDGSVVYLSVLAEYPKMGIVRVLEKESHIIFIISL